MKPIAWMSSVNGETVYVGYEPADGWLAIPLYTHPAELTDEEIQELALSDEFWISEDCTIFDWHKFAKAILKKAQGEG
jgi:hypothetical protein